MNERQVADLSVKEPSKSAVAAVVKEEEVKLVRDRGKKKDSIIEGADQVGNPSFTSQLLEQRNALIRPKGVEISPKMINPIGLGVSPTKKKELPELKLKN